MTERSFPYRFEVSFSAHFGAFSNSILDHVFSIPHDQRGLVEDISYGTIIPLGQNRAQRSARVCYKKDDKRGFYYVIAEAKTGVQDNWKVIGQSHDLHGEFRTPNPDEMVWFDQ